VTCIWPGLAGGHDDDFGFDTTDVIGRMLLPDLSPAAVASCEIFLDDVSFGIEIADVNGFFEFEDWPEEFEPILVRGTYVQPGSGTVFQGASPLVGTSGNGETNLGNIVLHPVDAAGFRAGTVPEGLACAGVGFADPDQDGRLALLFLDPATGAVQAVDRAR
jgi:hypothetical protein